jgi:hypothetical protein
LHFSTGTVTVSVVPVTEVVEIEVPVLVVPVPVVMVVEMHPVPHPYGHWSYRLGRAAQLAGVTFSQISGSSFPLQNFEHGASKGHCTAGSAHRASQADENGPSLLSSTPSAVFKQTSGSVASQDATHGIVVSTHVPQSILQSCPSVVPNGPEQSNSVNEAQYPLSSTPLHLGTTTVAVVPVVPVVVVSVPVLMVCVVTELLVTVDTQLSHSTGHVSDRKGFPVHAVTGNFEHSAGSSAPLHFGAVTVVALAVVVDVQASQVTGHDVRYPLHSSHDAVQGSELSPGAVSAQVGSSQSASEVHAKGSSMKPLHSFSGSGSY